MVIMMEVLVFSQQKPSSLMNCSVYREGLLEIMLHQFMWKWFGHYGIKS